MLDSAVKTILTVIRFLVGSFVLMFPLGLSAQGLMNPIQGVGSMGELLVKVAQVISYVSIPALVLAYIYVGFLFVAAQGNTDKIKKAKSMFLWTTVAAFLILGAPVIIELLQTTVEQLRG